jgi:hypothetical protein
MQIRVLNKLTVLFCIGITGVVSAQSNSHFSLQISTGLYPTFERIVYKTDPPQYGMILPFSNYVGCIATPAVTYNWKNNIVSLGIRTYTPKTSYIRTGAELSYEWIHHRPEKKLDHTFGAEFVYDYSHDKGSFLQYGPPFYYTQVKNNFIFLGTAGLRKTYPSRIYLFSTMGVGLLVPMSSLEVSETTRRFFSTPPHKMSVDKLNANLMFKIGLGYNLK